MSYARFRIIVIMFALVLLVLFAMGRIPSSLPLKNGLSLAQVTAIVFSNIPDPNLRTAVSVNPNYCNITPSNMLGEWNVACVGVPIHRYQKTLMCDQRNHNSCHAVGSEFSDCRSYYWTIDRNGSLINRLTPDGNVASISDTCRYLSNAEEDDKKMKELQLSKETTRIFMR